MSTKKIIKRAIIIFALLICGAIMIVNAMKKQEPIQNLLNEIESNEAELNLLEEKKSELESAIEQAKQKLLDEYWLQLSEQEELSEQDREPWILNESWDAQLMPEIQAEEEHERFKELSSKYGLDASQIRAVENHYWIKEWVILCITVAETSWWNRWAWWKNIWSVGSNDRWDRPTFALMESWLEAIWKTLTNKNLWKIQTLWCLSNAGSCQSRDDKWYRYATSDWNRERNMTACLSKIYWKINASEFRIRR